MTNTCEDFSDWFGGDKANERLREPVLFCIHLAFNTTERPSVNNEYRASRALNNQDGSFPF